MPLASWRCCCRRRAPSPRRRRPPPPEASSTGTRSCALAFPLLIGAVDYVRVNDTAIFLPAVTSPAASVVVEVVDAGCIVVQRLPGDVRWDRRERRSDVVSRDLGR